MLWLPRGTRKFHESSKEYLSSAWRSSSERRFYDGRGRKVDGSTPTVGEILSSIAGLLILLMITAESMLSKRPALRIAAVFFSFLKLFLCNCSSPAAAHSVSIVHFYVLFCRSHEPETYAHPEGGKWFGSIPGSQRWSDHGKIRSILSTGQWLKTSISARRFRVRFTGR